MQELLKKLNNFNIKIDLVDEKLDIQAPKGVMTEDLLNEIKLYKNDLIEFINSHKTKKEKHSFIPQVPIQSNYVLSSSQRRLWLLSQFEGGSAAYNMPSVFELKGNLVVSVLQKAFQYLIERHESLRTLFKEDETGQVKQFVLNPEESLFQLQFEDISNEENINEIIKNLIRTETNYSFDLSTDSLLRAKLIKTGLDTYVFVCVMHHIISDGQSAEMMTNELFILYDSIAKGNNNTLPALTIQYKDYATWQQDLLTSKDIERHKIYWLKQFEEELSILDLPTNKTRPTIKTYNGKSVNKVFNENLLKEFSDLCQAQGSTLFMGLLAVTKVLLYRYTNQTDIVIGSPIAGREHTDLQNQIGFYVNTLALRTLFEGKDSFKEILKNVKKVTLGAYEHQIYPFDELVVQLPLKRDMSRNPLFDVMVTLQNTNNLKTSGRIIDNIEVKEFRLEEEILSKFDMDLAFEETDKGLELILTYNTDIYSEEFAQRMIDHFEVLVKSILSEPKCALNSLTYLTQEEEKQLLFDFNDTQVDYPKNKTIIDLFEEQVERAPDNTAVIFEEKELSYKELNEKANQLGSYLRQKYDIKPDDLIGVKLDRSEKMLIAILGVLKSGAAYVPIDLTYPQERIDYLEKDSNSKILIDEQELEEFDKNQEQFSKSNIEKINKPNDLAYVIYTSGTTGNPKGVMVEHCNTVELLYWSNRVFDSAKFDIVYAVTSYCFDLSIFEFFFTLFSGKKMRVLKNALDIKDYIGKDKAILINTVPSVVRMILQEAMMLDNVSILNMAGESIPLEIIKQLSLETMQVFNLYGPSEDTTYSTYFELKKSDYLSIPIGKPISNTHIYILDDERQLLSIGVTGKLYVAGVGVSRGYLNKPELTKEKFLPNPFIEGTRMYDTGDLGRWLPDGNIEFLGRKDNQIKIRGFRIELAEIEAYLFQFSKSIKEVVVVAKEVKREKVLVAYYVAEELLDKIELRKYMQQRLPQYMVPDFYVVLNSLPLNSNGKTDYKSLPSISEEDIIRKEYAPPITHLEKKIVKIWQEVLSIDKIGIHDDFFVLGGNSLKIISIINKVELYLNVLIKINDFFKFSTPFLIAEYIEKIKEKSIHEKIESIAKKDYYEITHSQFGIWFDCQKSIDLLKSYNMVYGLSIKGVLDTSIIEILLYKLIERHEILRTIFTIDEPGVVQKIIDLNNFFFNFKIENIVLNEDNISEYSKQIIEEEKNRIFDLENGPLVHFRYIVINGKQSLFIFNCHHIICDGASLKVVIDDFFDFYKNLQVNKNYSKQPLEVQFKEYTNWLNNKIELNKLEYRSYWMNQLLPLPKQSFKYNGNLQPSYKGRKISLKFDNELVKKVKGFILQKNITEYIFYISSAAVLINEWTGNEKIIFLSPFSLRPNILFENQIGLFLNTVPICIKIKENQAFEDLIVETKKTTLNNFNNNNYYYPFANIIDSLKEEVESINGNFNVMFTIQNQNMGMEKLVESINFDINEIVAKPNSLSKLDLTFSLSTSQYHEIEIEYNEYLFDEISINRFINRYLEIVSQNVKKF